MQTFVKYERCKRWVLSLLAFLLPIVIASPIIAWQTRADLNDHMQNILLKGTDYMDLLLRNAYVANERAAPYLGTSCSEAIPYLRELVATTPDIRTLNLAKKGTIYCNSLRGEANEHYRIDNYIGKELYLMSGNRLTPLRPVLAFKRDYEQGTVITGVTAYYLTNILILLDYYGHLSFHVGDNYLDQTGAVMTQPLSPTLRNTSHHYPYSLAVKLTINDYWLYFKNTKQTSTMLVLLMSIGLGGFAYWKLGQASSMQGEVKRAIQSNEFIPYVQPIVDGSGQLCHIEVLARWQHPVHGLVRPDLFIPLAEESGLIIPITTQLMAQVEHELSLHQSQFPEHFSIGFNISAKHCVASNLFDDCKHFIETFNNRKHILTLELTERELVIDSDEAKKLFQSLDKIGVLLAIDDFGTGHSSLNYLQEFKFDILKIDRSFITMIGSDAISSHIVENLVDLAKRLGLKTIAEGVETQGQIDFLNEREIDYLQGYFFYKPMPLSEFITLLKTT
ncbi:EAL domain-containing protein [Vibrio sp. V23_P3S9T160]|nr:EAL domain-containing protein [Vibrio sp. V23_P3S9T160]OXX40808.1 cyclic diguanylate phosphodiesterase [Vibrio sp. V11_P1A41T118]